MKGSKRFRIPSGRRLIALAVIAVLAPAVGMMVIQYRSLTDLERKTQAAAQESLRQALQGLSRKAEAKLNALALEVLHPVASLDLRLCNDNQISRYFERVLIAHPEIDHLFVCSKAIDSEERIILHYKRDGLHRVYPDQIKDEGWLPLAQKGYDGAVVLRSFTAEAQDVLFWQEIAACGPVSKANLTSYVFLPLREGAKAELPAFAGFTLRQRYLTEEFFPELYASLFSDVRSDEELIDLEVTLMGEKQMRVFASSEDSFDSEVKISMAPAFPKMESAIGYRGVTLEGLARKSFYESLLLTLFVLSALVAGILLTLRATARELRLAQAKSTFVSNVSHELKTPLSLIRLFAETLEMGRVKTAADAQEYYRIINRESQRLTHLINNILDFARIEAGRKEYQFEQADIGQVVEEVVTSYKHQLVASGFNLQVEILRPLPSLEMDREAVAQAVLNLLTNAVKYSDHTKEITIRVFEQKESVAIEVADCGIGIPRAEQEKIFENFYRVSTGLVHNTKGSGMGLALVKHVIEAHGGRIQVESTAGAGSCFTILLPVTRRAVEAAGVEFNEREFRVATDSHS